MSDRRPSIPALPVLVALVVALMGSCSTAGDDNGTVEPVTIPAASMSTIVLAWSEVGMHDVSPTYDREVFLPPYSTIRAQVILRGDPPEIVTTGITLEYSIVGNTSSYGKSTLNPLREYAGFWDNSLELFGIDLVIDTGLNLVDPTPDAPISENAVWVDGKREAVTRVQLAATNPDDAASGWTIAADSVDVSMTAIAHVEQRLDVPLLRHRLRHVVGSFSGHVRTASGQIHDLENVIGIAEDYDTWW